MATILGCHGYTADEYRSALKSAWELGYRDFDVAAAYDLKEVDGETKVAAAKVLGQFLRAVDSENQARVHAKIHLLSTEQAAAEERVISAFAQMQGQLGTKSVHALKIHGPFGRKGELLPWGAGLQTMWKLKKQGQTHQVGICNINLAQAKQALALAKEQSERLDVVEIESNAYCPNTELVQLLNTAGVHVVAYRILAADKTPENGIQLTKHEVVTTIAARLSCTVSEVVVAFAKAMNMSVLYRSRNADRLKEVLNSKVALDPSDLQSLQSLRVNGFQSCAFWKQDGQ